MEPERSNNMKTNAMSKGKGFLLLASIFFIFLFINLTSALDWSSFSPSSLNINNVANLNQTGYFNVAYSTNTFNYNNSGLTYSNIWNVDQPRLTTITVGNVQYVIFTDGNDLSVYNPSMAKLGSINSGSQVESLNLFAGSDTNTIQIAGLFQNTSGIFYKIYNYTINSNSFSIDTLNTTSIDGGVKPSGLTCVKDYTIIAPGITCFGYDGNFNTYYENGTTISSVVYDYQGTSFYTGQQPNLLNDNGVIKVLTYSGYRLILHYLNGTKIFEHSILGSGYNYVNAIFFRDSPTTFKIASTRILRPYQSDSAMVMDYLTLTGNTFNSVGSQVIAMGTWANTLEPGNLVTLQDTQATRDLVVVPFSYNGNTYLRMYDLYGNMINLDPNTDHIAGDYLGYAFEGYGGNIISARLEGNNPYPEFILNPGSSSGTMVVIATYPTIHEVLHQKGSFIPTDINSDGALELLGYTNTGLTLLSSSFVPSVNDNGYQNQTQTGSAGANDNIPGLDSFINMFPPASSLTLVERLGLVLAVMLVTVIGLLFLGNSLGSEGFSKAMVYIILILLVFEFVFFVGNGYISVGIVVLLVAIGIIFGYLSFKRGGGG